MPSPSPAPPPSPGSRLRALLAEPRLHASFAPHDVFTALLLEHAGYELLFVGGFGVAASLLGLPDLQFPTLSEMSDAVRRIAGRVRVPVIADGDTGHGDLIHVQRTVREFERAGAAGIILEDQAAPKRCGHFEGKRVATAAEFELRLRAALEARSDPDFVVVARTDARASHGLEEAVRRANRALQLGADVAFVEAPHTAAEVRALPGMLHGPALANLLTGGRTPILPLPELEAAGYRLAVAPIETLLVTARAVLELAAEMRRGGRVDHLAPARMASFAEVQALLGVEELLALRPRLESTAGEVRPGEAPRAAREDGDG